MEIGRILIIAGGLILLAGLLFTFFGDRLGWIGNLPGDIRIERENFSFYFPLTTMILLSILLSLLFALVSRIFRG